MKGSQSKISDLDTRSNLPEREKSSKFTKAQEGIARMDKIIRKESTGRSRTRTGGDETVHDYLCYQQHQPRQRS